ncbi:MAG: hypothetical protein JWR02_1460 [Mucilaginibacter sp.]|nr:hypothetical protein [Mucilaginibacter sp.]
MEVLVFITNIESAEQVGELKPLLTGIPEIRDWNFDLDDCDNILRIEAVNISPRHIEYVLQTAGYICRELEY